MQIYSDFCQFGCKIGEIDLYIELKSKLATDGLSTAKLMSLIVQLLILNLNH